MKKIVLICDGCNRGDDDGVRVSGYLIEVGQERDTKTNKCFSMWERVDYCDECYHKAVGKHSGEIRKI